MRIRLTYDEFCDQWYTTACEMADITIAGAVKTNGRPFDPSMDIESVKLVSVVDSLEKTYSSYDSDNPKHASLKTFLSTVVHNTVLSELKKEGNAVKSLHLFSKPRRDKMEKYRYLYPSILEGVKSGRGNTPEMEAHTFQRDSDWAERKEDLLEKLPGYIRQLKPEDQIILEFWLDDEKDYIERCLEYFEWEDNARTRNTISRRRTRAVDSIADMMGSLKSDYKSIYTSEEMKRPEAVRWSLKPKDRRILVIDEEPKVTVPVSIKSINYRRLADKLLGKIHID